MGVTDHSTPRDRWGRAMLYPPEGGERAPYTRPSTAKGWLDDKSGLITWKASQVALGLMKSKALQARTAALVARGGGYGEHKPQLREIVDTAATLAGGDDAALQGTSLHEFTELIDQGLLDWAFVPEELRGPIEAYQEATERLKFVDSEVFVTTEAHVDDQPFRLAGSLDRLYELDGQILVGDLKTGANEPSYPLGVTTQVAIYAHGRRYRDDLFTGSPPFKGGEPNVDGTAYRADLHEHVSQTTGLMIHLPINRVRNKWVCNLYALDLEKGWAAACMGFRAQQMRRMPKLEKI